MLASLVLRTQGCPTCPGVDVLDPWSQGLVSLDTGVSAQP